MGETAPTRLPLTVGLDGGYVHSCEQKSKKEGWFEVIVGKSFTAEGASECFGFVNDYDTKPKRQLLELLQSQGMQIESTGDFPVRWWGHSAGGATLSQSASRTFARLEPCDYAANGDEPDGFMSGC